MRFARDFLIGGRKVGGDAPCFVIAEAGVNHFGDMDKAFALIDLAVAAKADVFKIQHFKTDLLVSPSAQAWRDRLRSKELTDEQVMRIRRRCDDRGIVFMCTGHDEASLDFLDRAVDVPAFKIGSGELLNWPYLRDVARRRKPIILSTGMYTLQQIEEAASVLWDAGCRKLAILHCVTLYPTEPHEVNLKVMDQIRGFFGGPVGYSDHTAGTAVPLAAVALGASVLEKHITIDRDVPNAQDWKVSCDPSNFVRFMADIREIEASRGRGAKKISAREAQSIQWARKSLTAAIDIASGTKISAEMLLAQRPGTGIAPSKIEQVIGRVAARDISRGTLLSLEDFAARRRSSARR